MKLLAIQARLNKALGGERHSLAELTDYLDNAIDDINNSLASDYTVISELDPSIDTYDLFPDASALLISSIALSR